MTDTLEDMLSAIMIADDAVPTTETSKAAFPEYPDEKPKKVDLTRWIDTWDEDLDAN